MKDYLADAILSLCPNSQFILSNDDYSTIDWHILKGTPPIKKQVDDEMARLKANDAKEIENKATAKVTAQAKLSALGLTTDDLKALGL